MASFIINDVAHYLYFNKPFDYDQSEIKDALLALLNREHAGFVARPFDNKTDVRLLSEDKSITVWLDPKSIMVVGWLSGNEEADQATIKVTHKLIGKILGHPLIPKNYTTLNIRSIGYYFPTDSSESNESRDAVLGVLRGIFKVSPFDDVLSSSIRFSSSTDYTKKDISYSAKHNNESDIYAVKIEAYQSTRPEEAMTADEAVDQLMKSSVLDDLKHGRDVLDGISK